MIIIIYREIAWVSTSPPSTAEAATLEPVHIHSLIKVLTQAATQARGDKKP
jgi:hypothetical protein